MHNKPPHRHASLGAALLGRVVAVRHPVALLLDLVQLPLALHGQVVHLLLVPARTHAHACSPPAPASERLPRGSGALPTRAPSSAASAALHSRQVVLLLLRELHALKQVLGVLQLVLQLVLRTSAQAHTSQPVKVPPPPLPLAVAPRPCSLPPGKTARPALALVLLLTSLVCSLFLRYSCRDRSLSTGRSAFFSSSVSYLQACTSSPGPRQTNAQ